MREKVGILGRMGPEATWGLFAKNSGKETQPQKAQVKNHLRIIIDRK